MKTKINNELAERLATIFYEYEGGVEHPVLEAWCKCEETFGEIAPGTPTECINELFLQTINYVIDALEIEHHPLIDD